MNTWNRQFANRISNVETLKNKLELTKKEELYIKGDDINNYPFAVTPYYFSLIDKANPDDPVRKQCIPSIDEKVIKEYESLDPLSEDRFSPVPRLVHRYKNRVLLLVTDTCAVYCRHCFRRTFTGNNSGCISKEDLVNAIEYINKHTEINEILLSGGDPITLNNKILADIFDRIVGVRRKLTVRICTRVPVVMPGRINEELINVIKKLDTVWIVTQFNHYKELTAQSIKAMEILINSGIPVINQTVLLKGINDNKEVLVKLFTELVLNRIKPYYIFQGDLACGTGHFRTNLNQATALIKEVYSEVSGIARPLYAVDLPGGGGKIILDCNRKYKSENGFYRLKDNNGEVYFYPEE